MKRSLILIFISLSLASCSLLKPAVKISSVTITDEQYEKIIKESVDELLSAGWLSDFLTTQNQRPIVMVSQISNSANVIANNSNTVEWFEKDLIESGQVRVVKSTVTQRQINPVDLAKGESVDFVLSANFEKQVDTSPAITIFVVSLWSDTNTQPILVVKKEIKENLSE